MKSVEALDDVIYIQRGSTLLYQVVRIEVYHLSPV